MNIYQIIGATEGWRAVFYEDGKLEFKPVIGWGLVSHEDREGDRFVDGLVLQGNQYAIPTTEYHSPDFDIWFLQYIAPNEISDERALFKKGKEIQEKSWRTEVGKELLRRLRRKPTKEEIEVALRDEGFKVHG